MRKRSIIGAAVIMTFGLLASGNGALAAEKVPVHITGYCLKGITASGEETHEGICAFRPEDIGKTAKIYDADGELLGEYKISDTGRKGGGVRRGTTVDIWKPTRAECRALTQDGFIEIIEEGGKNDK